MNGDVHTARQLRMEGRLGDQDVAGLREVLVRAERERPQTLFVDLRDVSEISADALAELLAAGSRADADGRRVMILCDPRSPVGRLVHLTMRSRRLRLAYASPEPLAA